MDELEKEKDVLLKSNLNSIAILMGILFTFAFMAFLFYFLYKQNEVLTTTNQNMWFSLEKSKNEMKELEQKNRFLKKENAYLKSRDCRN